VHTMPGLDDPVAAHLDDDRVHRRSLRTSGIPRTGDNPGARPGPGTVKKVSQLRDGH
jgi:hypothetical protein